MGLPAQKMASDISCLFRTPPQPPPRYKDTQRQTHSYKNCVYINNHALISDLDPIKARLMPPAMENVSCVNPT